MTLIKANAENDDVDASNKQNFKSKSKSFDARRVLEEFAEYEFGSQNVNVIHLAIMETKDVDGFYKCTTSIRFWNCELICIHKRCLTEKIKPNYFIKEYKLKIKFVRLFFESIYVVFNDI